MAWSHLIDGIELADESNYGSRNGRKICKITPHHTSGILTGRQCAKIFQNPNRKASANYCIGYEGDIILNVDEEYRAYSVGAYAARYWNDNYTTIKFSGAVPKSEIIADIYENVLKVIKKYPYH